MRRFPLNTLFVILLMSTVLLGGFPMGAVAETPVEKIVNHPDSFDGQQVSVTGTVSNLKFGSLEVGNHYTTFMLVSKSGGRVKVFAREKLTLKAGQEVQVTGVYRKVWTSARRYFYNQIVASEIK